jgi:hypothetical protein
MRNYTTDLKTVRVAIDQAVTNGGVQSVSINGLTVALNLDQLRRMERDLENKIRIRNGGGRTAGY